VLQSDTEAARHRALRYVDTICGFRVPWLVWTAKQGRTQQTEQDGLGWRDSSTVNGPDGSASVGYDVSEAHFLPLDPSKIGPPICL
jgi:hypothetical protein